MATRRLIRLLGERRGSGGRLVKDESVKIIWTDLQRCSNKCFETSKDTSHWFALWHQLRSVSIPVKESKWNRPVQQRQVSGSEVNCTGKQENKDIRLESLQGHRRVIKELYDHSGDADRDWVLELVLKCWLLMRLMSNMSWPKSRKPGDLQNTTKRTMTIHTFSPSGASSGVSTFITQSNHLFFIYRFTEL